MSSAIRKQVPLFVLIVVIISACTFPTTEPGNATTIPSPPPPTSHPVSTPQEPTQPVPPTATSTSTAIKPTATDSLLEASVQLIPIDGAISFPEAEVSGMTWFGDLLLILPQYPKDYLSPVGSPGIFALPKADILTYLDGSSSGPLESEIIPITNTQFTAQIPGYEGFEAIAIDGNSVYLSIEANDRGVMQGYLIQGLIASDGSSIDLVPGSLTEVPTPVQIFNSAYETLIASGGKVLAFFEANGRDLNPGAYALLYDPQSRAFSELDLDQIEYRFTDSTELDADGKFWVLNVFMPIEFWFYSNSDAVADQFGRGNSHLEYNHVERLLELKYNEGQITLSGKAPLYLEFIDDANARNWEALVRLDDRGFLAMTDTYPGTVLGFIPFPGR